LIAQSGRQISNTLVGTHSKALLKFQGYDTERKTGLLFWDNSDGEDPAHVVSAMIYSPILPINGSETSIRLPGVAIPAKRTLSYDPIRFDMVNGNRILLSIIFHTMSASYMQLLAVDHDGNTHRQAYHITEMSTAKSTHWIDPSFPIETSEFSGLVKSWNHE
jgi:hypothetical protein